MRFLKDCIAYMPLCITFGVAAGDDRSPVLWAAFIVTSLVSGLWMYWCGIKHGSGRK